MIMERALVLAISICLHNVALGTVPNSHNQIKWITLTPTEIPLAFQYPDGFEKTIWTYTYICRTTQSSVRIVGKLTIDTEFGMACRYYFGQSNVNMEVCILCIHFFIKIYKKY